MAPKTSKRAVTSAYIAKASARIREITALEKMSGFSAVAEAIALPAAPIPKPAPKDAAPIVRPAANIRVPPSIVVRAGIAKIDKGPPQDRRWQAPLLESWR